MSEGGVSEYFAENRARMRRPNGDVAFLSEVAARFGFSNITYFFLRSKAVTGSPGTLLTTYAKDWQSHYFSMNYEEIDPIILTGMRSFLPVDWALVPRPTRAIRQFFGEAMEFGLSDQGVTVPVRGASGETALVSLNPEAGRTDWAAFLKQGIADITYFAFLLHGEVLDLMTHPDAVPAVELSRREKEVLQWAALGKTSWETSVILGLSERTIEFYLGNAASKLRAGTKTQAVSRAISEGHILMDAFMQAPGAPRTRACASIR